MNYQGLKLDKEEKRSLLMKLLKCNNCDIEFTTAKEREEHVGVR